MKPLLITTPSQNLDLKLLAYLAHKLTNTQRNISLEHLVAVLRYPHKMIFNLMLGMAASAIIHTRILIQLLAQSYPAIAVLKSSCEIRLYCRLCSLEIRHEFVITFEKRYKAGGFNLNNGRVKCIGNCGSRSAFHYELADKFNEIPKKSRKIEVGYGYVGAADFNDAQDVNQRAMNPR